jgi:hypothetical protein
VQCRSDTEEDSKADHRVKLSAVDKVVRVETKRGAVGDLFTRGVFLGQVEGEEGIVEVERRLGIDG